MLRVVAVIDAEERRERRERRRRVRGFKGSRVKTKRGGEEDGKRARGEEGNCFLLDRFAF